MVSVFLVQHLHVLASGEDVKIIGIYRTHRSALDAVNRLKSQPGFNANSRLVSTETDAGEGGFYIEEYKLGQDHWPEGFVTVDA